MADNLHVVTDLMAERRVRPNIQQRIQSDEHANLLIAQGLPPYAELARQGAGPWHVMNTSALASVVVRPSTTAMLTLWNGDPQKSYVIDRVFGHNLVAVANSDYGLWLCMHPAGMAKPTADITAIRGPRGQLYGGSAVVDTAAAVVDDGWFPWGNSVANVTITVPGGQVEARVEGRLIVPPTGAISVQTVSDTTGVTMTTGFAWWEVDLTLGNL